jgi:hypothetical protein
VNDDVTRAVNEYDRALGKLSRLGCASAVSKRNYVEAVYGAAYQRLVKLGARPQIRAKYRRLGN